MKEITLRNSLLGVGLISALGMSAAPIVIEAETPIESDQVSVAVLDAEGSEASGLAGLTMDNANRGSYAVYAFDAPAAGTYDLSVFYVTMNTRWISVQLNDQIATLLECDALSGGWNGVGGEVVVDDLTGESEYRDGVVSKTIPVYCSKGRNYLTVKSIYGYSKEEGRDQKFAPTIDRYEIAESAQSIDKPRDWDIYSDRITRQCDNYDAVSGNATTDDRAAFSNKRGANIGQAGGSFSYNVSVEEEGVYLMELWYATMQRRWISVKVNKQVPSYVSFADYSEGWGNDEGEWICQRQVPLYLTKGTNTITFGQYTKDSGKDMSEHGDSPALDYFTLDLVNLPGMTEPEKEIAMYKASIAEAAKWSGTIDTDALRDHNEYTVATSSSTSAQIVLEFPVPVIMSGYAFSTDNNSEGWTVETSADGNVWTEADVVSSAVNSNITTRTASSDGAVRFVRLNISGNEPVSIGDFAVFGNFTEPLESALIAAGFNDYESTHAGFDTGDWHEGIDKLFDGDPFTQFTVAQDGDGGMGDNDDIRITVFLPIEATVKAYSLSTHSTSYLDRAPKTWTLEAFDYDANDGDGSYVTVDSRDGMDFAVSASTILVNVAEPVSSDCYVLTLKNRRDRATHLSDFQLYGEAFEEIEVSGVNEVFKAESAITVASGRGYVAMGAPAGSAYTIYNLSGCAVASGVCNEGTTAVTLDSGLYIVTVGGRAVKALVK